MRISLVAAMDRDGIIGKDNKLPWPHNKTDMQRFRRLTMGRTVIMGRVTYTSIAAPLKGRRKIVLSRKSVFSDVNTTTVSSVADALALAGQSEVMVLGGQVVFEQFMPLADTIYLSVFKDSYGGDTKFPAIDNSRWNIICEESFHDHSFILYKCETTCNY